VQLVRGDVFQGVNAIIGVCGAFGANALKGFAVYFEVHGF
jgi:hypothetical protein